jgi:uncharacterized membrane protein YcjF (UPF0283 family)
MGTFLRRLRQIGLIIGLLLGFMVCVELLHAYTVLSSVAPWLGALFAYGLTLLLLALLARMLWTIRAYPVLRHPPSRDDHPAYARYLIALSRHLVTNRALDDTTRTGVRQIPELLGADKMQANMERTIATVEQDHLAPAITQLDLLARARVQAAVRDVMLGVTLSPWHSIDLVVAFYRNVKMILDVVRIYETRPRLHEQLAISRDVLSVVATVNILNYGSKLLQNLGASVPGLGRFADDIAQGMGAGLVTSIAGHAAVERCRCYHAWDAQQVEDRLHRKLGTFATDLRNIVMRDIWPRLGVANLTDKVREGVGSSIDATNEAMESFVMQPAKAVGRTMVKSGGAVGSGISAGVRGTVRGLGKGSMRLARGVGSTTVTVLHGAGKLVRKLPLPHRRNRT